MLIKNYLKVSLRTFKRNVNYTLTNILGLTIGLSCGLLIFLLIRAELSFDNFHLKNDRIFRIINHSENASGLKFKASTPYPLADAIRNDLSGIDNVTQIHFQEDEVLLQINGDKFEEKNIVFADSNFFDVFDFKQVSGHVKSALAKPGNVLITKSFAEKYFSGDVLPGQMIKVDHLLDLRVAGIIEDPPVNSHLQFSMIVSFPSLIKDFVAGFPLDQWGVLLGGYTYVVLPSGENKANIEHQLKQIVEKYYDDEEGESQQFLLQPLREIQHDTRYTASTGIEHKTDKSVIWLLALIGVFILLIACINFINLSTALAVKKSKEIGIRKTLGAHKMSLSRQFLLETFLLTFFSVLCSLAVVEISLPFVNQFLGKSIVLDLLGSPDLVAVLLLATLLVTLLSGLYPAFVLASYDPVLALKNKITSRNSSSLIIRKGLVVFQFCIAQVLIIGTIIIASQLNYFKTKSLGFATDAIINVPLPDKDAKKLNAFKTRLKSSSMIQNATFSLGAPTSRNEIGTDFYLTSNGNVEKYNVAIKPVDFNYLKTYGLNMALGRWFTKSEEKLADFSLEKSEQKYSFVINETAVKKLGFKSPEEALNEYVSIDINGISGPIVGVVRDFHVTSLHEPIEPVLLMHFPYLYYDAGIKIPSGNISESIAFIKKSWEAVYPEYLFSYAFLDDDLNSLYKNEAKIFDLFKVFSGISIFICCLGLLGLTSFITILKTKEVGIRKVFGATSGQVVMLLSKDFVKLVLIAFIIALPFSWWGMREWLAEFAYRVNMQAWFFGVGILITLLIAFLTIGYQSIKAANADPVKSLKNE